MATPVETKVRASTAAAAVSGIALWLIGRYVFRGTAVPDVLQSWIYTLAPAVVTFGAGYLAKHTSRPPAAPDRPTKTLLPPAAPGPPPSVPELLAPPVAPPPAAPE